MKRDINEYKPKSNYSLDVQFYLFRIIRNINIRIFQENIYTLYNFRNSRISNLYSRVSIQF